MEQLQLQLATAAGSIRRGVVEVVAEEAECGGGERVASSQLGNLLVLALAYASAYKRNIRG